MVVLRQWWWCCSPEGSERQILAVREMLLLFFCIHIPISIHDAHACRWLFYGYWKNKTKIVYYTAAPIYHRNHADVCVFIVNRNSPWHTKHIYCIREFITIYIYSTTIWPSLKLSLATSSEFCQNPIQYRTRSLTHTRSPIHCIYNNSVCFD